ncbi:hypothetical protein SAMN06265784_12074 [Paraburkholderia susongensis]|uniref:Uncharacterized protein n=1 Tax=Paraburkholderia susongensis TaxID=1515439 RepID=A0A1X7M6G3_9BURK|nr:hypothetical protein SAMN06265784_12074 [Paraburkholderia susongensis]
MELMNVACPVWPDAEELRMLRALVQEGVAASRHGAYAAQFHGWCIRICRVDGPLRHSMHIDIRSRDGTAWARGCWWTIYVGGDVV